MIFDKLMLVHMFSLYENHDIVSYFLLFHWKYDIIINFEHQSVLLVFLCAIWHTKSTMTLCVLILSLRYTMKWLKEISVLSKQYI